MHVSWQIVLLILIAVYGLVLTALLLRRRRSALGRVARGILIENLDDHLVVLDGRDRVVDLNPAAARGLGVAPGRALGAPAADILSPWPGVQAALNQRGAGKAEVTFNGAIYELTILPVPGEHGHNGARILTLREVTRRKRIEADLQRAKEAAEMADRAKSQFLAMMSHEIRTPLNGVVGFTELLQGTPLDPEQKEFVELAVQSGRTLLVIIDDVLDYSKIEAGQLVLEEVPINVSGLILDTLKPFLPQAKAKGIELAWSLDPGLPAQVRGDPTRIAQVLNNLVGNAVKFTQTGGVTVRLSGTVVSAVAPPIVILSLEVADTGIGIAADALAGLIRPFSQADASTTRIYGGTGLGLAITRRLCELMGGRLQVTSDPAKGSVFTASLQTHVESAAPPPVELAAPVVISRQLKLLACEDNLINQKLLQALLLRRGHQVDFAEDGAFGLECVEQSSYDLIFVDLAMPRVDGREFVRRVRQRERDRSEPARYLIALTASAMKGERERCLAAGMDDFLTKPLDQVALDQALAQFAVRDSSTAPAK